MSSPSREQFVQQVLKVVKDRFPVAKVTRAQQPFSLMINGQLASLENLYRSSVLQPQHASSLIEQWILEIIRTSEGTPDLTAGYDELADRIMPLVLSEGSMGPVGAGMVFQPLIAGLMVAYAIDSQRSLMYVSRQAFERWGVSLEQVHDQAIENLVSRSQAIAAHAAQDQDGQINLILFQTMDGYDASRILLPTLHERLREHLGSPFAAAIPNRDILLCFRNDSLTVERLREQISKDFQQMPHPVTDRLLLVTADGIAPRD